MVAISNTGHFRKHAHALLSYAWLHFALLCIINSDDAWWRHGPCMLQRPKAPDLSVDMHNVLNRKAFSCYQGAPWPNTSLALSIFF